MHAERCQKTKREAVLFNQKRQMKVKKENGLKKNLKQTKKFVLQDGTINKAVEVNSNFLGSKPSATAIRYNRKQRKHVQIKQPNTIKQYNIYIGGIDLANYMVANYRFGIKREKCWWPIFSNYVDLSIVNTWKLWWVERGN